MDEIVLDLTDPENDDWIKVSQAGLEDLALSLPPGTDLLAYLQERPDMPLARAVLSGNLQIPDDLPRSSIGQEEQRLQELRQRLEDMAPGRTQPPDRQA
jgi:hypothetical protein